MGRFARIFKCICGVIALGILITGLAAQAEKSTEVVTSSATAVLTASITEDYTDTEAPHATIRRGSILTEVEVSKEATGGNSNETIMRRTSGASQTASTLRFLSTLTMILAAASVCSSISRPVVHAEGNVHSAEQTIISYIHSQGNFIG